MFYYVFRFSVICKTMPWALEMSNYKLSTILMTAQVTKFENVAFHKSLIFFCSNKKIIAKNYFPTEISDILHPTNLSLFQDNCNSHKIYMLHNR